MPTVVHSIVHYQPLLEWQSHSFPATHFSPFLTFSLSLSSSSPLQEMSHQYWPTQLKAKQLYGKNSVTLISEEHPFGAKEIVVRKFEITDEKVHVCSRPPSMQAGESVCVGIREGAGCS